MNSLTNIDITTLIYNYYDSTTASIIIRWANKYAEDHNVNIDYAMAVTLLDIHKRSKHS